MSINTLEFGNVKLPDGQRNVFNSAECLSRVLMLIETNLLDKSRDYI